MAGRKVVWTLTAQKQLEITLRYWATRNQNNRYSKKIASELKSRLKTLSNFPFSGTAAQSEGMRKIAMGHFSVYYMLNDNQLIVLLFWDNRQDPEELLRLLKSV